MHVDTWNAVLTIPPKILNNGGKMAQNPRMIKKIVFFLRKKGFFRKKFLLTRRMHFWHHRQNVLPEAAKKSRCTEAKRKTKLLSKQKIQSSPNCALGHIEFRFSDHAKTLCDKLPKVFCSLYFFQKSISSKYSLGQLKSNSESGFDRH